MKRFFGLVLVLWFALQAGLVHAHQSGEDLHMLDHAAQSESHHDSDLSDESCGVPHCCCPVGLPPAETLAALGPGLEQTAAPAHSAPLYVPRNTIERPKWGCATPAVASL